MVYKTLNDLCPIISLTSSPTTAPLIHSAIATLASLLFLKHTRHASTSKTLHWLFPLPVMLPPQTPK